MAKDRSIILLNTEASSAINPELPNENGGFVLQRKNFELVSNETGSILANRKTKTASKEYSLGVDNSYACIRSTGNDKYDIGIFSDNTNVIITVNAQIVLITDKIPYTTDTELNVVFKDISDDSVLLLNDRINKPLVFSINDLLENIGTQKYFSEFDLSVHTPNASFDMQQIKINKLVSVGSGLKAGSYSYSYRLVSNGGAKTTWSVTSPMVSVPLKYTSQRKINGYNVYGGESGKVTPYGIEMSFRITNSNQYDYIEIRRNSHTAGLVDDTIPYSEYKIVRNNSGNYIDIRNVKHMVIDFLDNNSDWEPLAKEDDVINYSSIKKVDAQWLFNNMIWYGGIEYDNREVADLPDQGIFKADAYYNNIGYPIKKNLTEKGYADFQNNVYYKSLMSGDKYGWAIILYDEYGNKTFAIPYKDGDTGDYMSGWTSTTPNINIHDLSDYKMPERRERINPSFESDIDSSQNSKWRATLDGSVSRTHEVFGDGTKKKDDTTTVINIITLTPYPYNPFKPTGTSGYLDNESKDNYDIKINTNVYDGYNLYTNYNPRALEFPIYANGMRFVGIDETKLPSWVSGFSIARTKRKGRVVAQGLAMYSLGESSSVKKQTNKIWFHSPDIMGNCIHPELYDEIINNPDLYKVQLVSPVGFFTEVYDGAKINSRYGNIDMHVHAKIGYESGLYNKTDNINGTDYAADIGGGDGFVRFGKWRNIDSASFPSNYIFDIDSVTERKEGRSLYLEIELNKKIYKQSNVITVLHFKDSVVRNFHEPFYIVNIIKEETADTTAYNTYSEECAYIKLRSIIGYGDGVTKEFRLTSEREVDAEDGVFVNGVKNTNISIKDGRVVFINAPGEGDVIEVRYNNEKPIDVFMGDTYINDTQFLAIDRENINSGADLNAYFKLNAPFPYSKYTINSNIKRVYSWNEYNPEDTISVEYIRQMIVSYFCETSENLNYKFGDVYPYRNYVLRPYKWRIENYNENNTALMYYDQDSSKSNGICVAYNDDYNEEFKMWGYGGFYVDHLINIDYSKSQNKTNISTPDVNYVPKYYYKDLLIWSDAIIQDYNIDILKNIPITNQYQLRDSHGGITALWDGGYEFGNVLYVLSNNGAGYVLFGKEIVRSYNGDPVLLSIANSDERAEQWISNIHGLPYDKWNTLSDNGMIAIFSGSDDVYLLTEKEIKGIGGAYIDIVKNNILNKNRVYTIYDIEHKKWMFCSDGVQVGYVFSDVFKGWVGIYDYEGQLYATSKLKAINVDEKGIGAHHGIYEVTGGNDYRNGYIRVVMNPESYVDKDFEGLTVYSNNQPNKVVLSRSNAQNDSLIEECSITTFKNRSGYYNKIPLTINKKRLQGNLLFIQIDSISNNSFEISKLVLDFRKLKIL